MSVSDPIADMLTRIRNGGMARHQSVLDPDVQDEAGHCPHPEGRRLYQRF